MGIDTVLTRRDLAWRGRSVRVRTAAAELGTEGERGAPHPYLESQHRAGQQAVEVSGVGAVTCLVQGCGGGEGSVALVCTLRLLSQCIQDLQSQCPRKHYHKVTALRAVERGFNV